MLFKQLKKLWIIVSAIIGALYYIGRYGVKEANQIVLERRDAALKEYNKNRMEYFRKTGKVYKHKD